MLATRSIRATRATGYGRRRSACALAFAAAWFLLAAPAHGQNVLVDRDGVFEPKTTVAPFAFYNENLEFGAGPVFVSNGLWQEQMTLLLGGFYTTNQSRSLFMFGNDIQLPFGERLFLDARVSLSKFDQFDAYVDGNPRYPDQRAGSHDSDENDFIEGDGDDDFVRLNLKYLLPMGHGRDRPVNTYVLDRGLLRAGATGGGWPNPLARGRTYLELETFYRNQEVTSRYVESKLRTNGLKFSLRYDNSDFVLNPTSGNVFRFSVSRDFGAFDTTGSWTAVEGEISQYISLGSTDRFRQITLAMNVWTSYSPTWADDDGQPPLFAGASLGGLDRMRGFPEGRYYDKAAMYYALELRLIPEWNPMGEGTIFEWLDVDWVMFVPFIEVGRVAERWSISALHDDMNVSAGLGFRAMAKNVVLRMDTGVSNEGARVQMMVQHPF